MSTDIWREIGNLLDRWDMMPNDLRGYLSEQDENFCRAVEQLRKAVEER